MGSSPTPTRQNQNQAAKIHAKIKIQKFAKRNQNQGVVLSLFCIFVCTCHSQSFLHLEWVTAGITAGSMLTIPMFG